MEYNAIALITKLSNIQKVFRVNDLIIRNGDVKEVAKYYKLNRFAYNLFHNKGGFIHMGISENGKFHVSDLLVQPDLVGKYIEKYKVKTVLELASGKGSNILYLAKKYPDTTFCGLDLPNGQLNLNNPWFKEVRNLEVGFGDFHNLGKYAPGKFDIVFIVEALCHSDRKEIVAKEVFRVLKDGGLFIIFDGYLNKTLIELSKEELLAKQLTEKGMVVNNFENVDEVIQKIVSAGLQLIEEKDYSNNIIPNLEKFEKLAGNTIFKHPLLGKVINKILPNEITFNAVSGYLMPTLIRDGIASYKLLVFQK
jgi:ubiquinone/menaquinone biosynthesis C-methylase UbiE